MRFNKLTWIGGEAPVADTSAVGGIGAIHRPLRRCRPFSRYPVYFVKTHYRAHTGLKESLRCLAITVGIALAINLPFILWNPHAWATGVLAPIVDPMFPLGDGIISLSINHVLPFFPATVYSALEVGALVLCLAWYWRICQKHPEAAMLLAVIPLFFAWRSLSSYFFYAAYSLAILMAAKVLPGNAEEAEHQPSIFSLWPLPSLTNR